MPVKILNYLQKREIQRLSDLEKHSQDELAEMFDVSKSTIRRVLEETLPADPDGDLVKENVRLAKQAQKRQDQNRIKNKSFREHARIENAIEEFTGSLSEVFKSNSLSAYTKPKVGTIESQPIGIIHFSDLHFNEQVHLESNIFNYEIASKRIEKHVTKALEHFKLSNVGHVLVALTGDILNSDRRLDELLENATNRSKAVFLAVDILQQAILHINNEGFNVTVASICGNEARVGKDIGWVADMASDNYDFVIHNIMSKLFEGSEGVNFLPITDPLEQIVQVNGCNVLLLHGHGHNGISSAKGNIATKVAQTKARYASRGIKIDYVLMGHIHEAYVSDMFARSGGLPGANAYSEKALNLDSRASQNYYIIQEDGSVDGVKNDLQNVDGYAGYKYDKELEAYHSKSAIKTKDNVVIHQIVI